MKRREIISLISGVAVGWSSLARAQQPAERVRRVGVLTPSLVQLNREVLQRALEQRGHKEGGRARSGRGAQRPASAFERTLIMTKEQKIIRAKVGLLELAQQLGNVSQACKMMGYSRDSFYRFKDLYETGGELALQELSRRKPLLANRTAPEIEALIIALSLEQPAFGQIRIANEVRERGHSISPAGVRSVWQRHELRP